MISFSETIFLTQKELHMKKIITLAFFVGAYSISFAQYHQQYNGGRNRNYAMPYGQYYHGQDRKFYEGNHFITRRERDFEITRINREFKMKVYSIRRNRYMRHHQKKLAIRSMEYERARQIQMVNARFNSQFYNSYGRR